MKIKFRLLSYNSFVFPKRHNKLQQQPIEVKKIVIVSSSPRFQDTISHGLACDANMIENVHTPKDFLSLLKVVEPALIILDFTNVNNEDLIGFYSITRWYEIQMIVTNEHQGLNFPFLLN